MIIRVIKQDNGMYSLEFMYGSLGYIVPDLTEQEVRNYEVPWCKIVFDTTVPIHVYPKRKINTKSMCIIL